MDRKNSFLILFFIIFTIIILAFPNFILAHPGNTSSDGCHFCRSNCDSWGYTYETRHGHHGEICDPSKGPIDPIYIGKPPVTATPTIKILPTSTPTPTKTPTPTMAPTETPTIVPNNVASLTPTPEVKGASDETKPATALSVIIFFGVLGGIGYGLYRLVKKIWRKLRKK